VNESDHITFHAQVSYPERRPAKILPQVREIAAPTLEVPTTACQGQAPGYREDLARETPEWRRRSIHFLQVVIARKSIAFLEVVELA
jgi:hypothetical protein